MLARALRGCAPHGSAGARSCERPCGSRLARQMRPHLGTGLWDEFVWRACELWHYKRRAGCARSHTRVGRVLRCVGAIDIAGRAQTRGARRDL